MQKKKELAQTIRDDVINAYGIDFYLISVEFDWMTVGVLEFANISIERTILS